MSKLMDALTSEVLFREVVALDHGTHRSVHNQDALAERAVERVNPLTPQSWSFRVLQWKILRQQKPARRALRCRASAF